jgi:hypothetical protein
MLVDQLQKFDEIELVNARLLRRFLYLFSQIAMHHYPGQFSQILAAKPADNETNFCGRNYWLSPLIRSIATHLQQLALHIIEK